MADYDPKSIPILDDVIDIDVDANNKGEQTNTESPITIDDDTLASTGINASPSLGEIDAIDEFINPQQTIDIDALDSTEEPETISGDDADIEIQTSEAPEPFEPEPLEPGSFEPEPYESALIGYLNDEPEEDVIEDNIEEVSTIVDTTSPTNETTQPDTDLNSAVAVPADTEEKAVIADTQAIEIEPLVNDIVQQLLPDLEQQLRYLVQQALEEKLPANLIKPASSDESSDS